MKGRTCGCIMLLLVGMVFGCSSAADDTEMDVSDNSVEIVETTNVELTDHQVAVGNILERELPDKTGATAMRMSAVLSIMDCGTLEEWSKTVIEGDSLFLGSQVYLVASIEAGDHSRGTLTLTLE